MHMWQHWQEPDWPDKALGRVKPQGLAEAEIISALSFEATLCDKE